MGSIGWARICPINDNELGTFEPARVEIVEELPPGGRALPTHIFDRKQNLLPVHCPTGNCAAICQEGRRIPIAARTEMFVARLPIRDLITVPSRMTRTMSSSARLRAHQASQNDRQRRIRQIA